MEEFSAITDCPCCPKPWPFQGVATLLGYCFMIYLFFKIAIPVLKAKLSVKRKATKEPLKPGDSIDIKF